MSKARQPQHVQDLTHDPHSVTSFWCSLPQWICHLIGKPDPGNHHHILLILPPKHLFLPPFLHLYWYLMGPSYHYFSFFFFFLHLKESKSKESINFNLNVKILESWLVWLSGLSTGPWIKGSLVWFPVRACARVAGQVPSRGRVRGNHTLMFLSFSSSLPAPLSKIK